MRGEIFGEASAKEGTKGGSAVISCNVWSCSPILTSAEFGESCGELLPPPFVFTLRLLERTGVLGDFLGDKDEDAGAVFREGRVSLGDKSNLKSARVTETASTEAPKDVRRRVVLRRRGDSARTSCEELQRRSDWLEAPFLALRRKTT